jgi:hypothetical protein
MSALTLTAPMPTRYEPPPPQRPSLLDYEVPQRARAPWLQRVASVIGIAAGLINPPAGEATAGVVALRPSAIAPSRVAGSAHDRLDALSTAFLEALAEARCMLEDEEMEAPDPDTWTAAHLALTAFLAGPFAEALDVPLISPMRRGGLSAEWHERGMNIELRFRGPRDVYAVIEDARGAIEDFRGRDPDLARAADAIAELAVRSD